VLGGVVALLLLACTATPVADTTSETSHVPARSTSATTSLTTTAVSATQTTVAVTGALPEGLLFEIEGDIAIAPGEVPSGLVEVAFLNRGESSHGVFVTDTVLRFGVFLTPGAQASGVVEFDPGTSYVFEALLPPFSGGEDAFIASEAASDMPAPNADVTVGLAEFAFSMPDRLEAGSQSWQLTNNGEQTHDVGIFSLEGTTLEQVLDEIDLMDPWEQPTVVPTWAVGSGETVWANLELAAGEYGIVCRVPDDASSREHFRLGMVLEITVGE
jgi:hypothetical protein